MERTLKRPITMVSAPQRAFNVWRRYLRRRKGGAAEFHPSDFTNTAILRIASSIRSSEVA